MKPAAALFLFAIGMARAEEVPSGAQIQVRLESAIASNKSKAGDSVQAVVISPVVVGSGIVIPAGTKLSGKVKEVQASKSEAPGAGSDASATPAERARLVLEFGDLAGLGAKPIQIPAKLVDIDNARETVDEAGRVLGILGSETLSAQMDKGLEKLGQRSSGLAEFLRAAKGAFVKQADAEIAYEPGTEMTIELTKSVEVKGAAAGKAEIPNAIPQEAELMRLVNALPFQTMAERPPLASDVTNLMFIGSQERVTAAFTKAGWTTAEALSQKSGMETVRAIVENRGYRQAPVSALLLDGRRPDLVFQKQNNTFAKRHHLRIWRRPEAFQGQTVWVAAATHDIAIEFSPENRTFIHKIDSLIDRERAKVTSDLLMTGMVAGLALVERPEVPRESRNATGDALQTDGAMAVLLLGMK